MRVVLGLALALAFAAPASAAETITITGTDALRWDKPDIGIHPGDTVQWSFAGTTQAHNVQAVSAAPADPVWQGFRAPTKVWADGGPAPKFTFDTPGIYDYVCEVHSGMTGAIKVGD